MKTVVDIYNEIDIPCIYCKYLFSKGCERTCQNKLLDEMCKLSEDMVLRGEY